jgi:CheY-like chemotaxis protein
MHMEFTMPPQSRVKTVLLVEDDKFYAEALVRVLKGAGFAVVAASNATAALHVVAAGGLDLIISDLHMPRMDGLEFRGEVAAKEPAGGGVPFVFLSGLMNDADRDVARGMGVQHCLQKPVDLTRLVELTRELTRFRPLVQRQAASETVTN